MPWDIRHALSHSMCGICLHAGRWYVDSRWSCIFEKLNARANEQKHLHPSLYYHPISAFQRPWSINWECVTFWLQAWFLSHRCRSALISSFCHSISIINSATSTVSITITHYLHLFNTGFYSSSIIVFVHLRLPSIIKAGFSSQQSLCARCPQHSTSTLCDTNGVWERKSLSQTSSSTVLLTQNIRYAAELNTSCVPTNRFDDHRPHS